jgi:hypothetical protein
VPSAPYLPPWRTAADETWKPRTSTTPTPRLPTADYLQIIIRPRRTMEVTIQNPANPGGNHAQHPRSRQRRFLPPGPHLGREKRRLRLHRAGPFPQSRQPKKRRKITHPSPTFVPPQSKQTSYIRNAPFHPSKQSTYTFGKTGNWEWISGFWSEPWSETRWP